MGCISSKVMCKSLSFQEELLQRAAKVTSATGRDHLLACLGTNNPVVNQLSSEISTPESKTSCCESATDFPTSATWVLTENFEQEEIKQGESASLLLIQCAEYNYLAKGCSSCHSFRELKGDGEIKDAMHAMSIHTVEEYDQMVGNIFWPKDDRIGLFDGSLPLHKPIFSYDEAKQPQVDNVSQAEESNAFEKELMGIFSGEINLNIDSTEDSYATQDENIFEKGFKRKAVANGLETLRIPPNFEFPGAVSFGEWQHVYSPGASYVTPKFGSYTLPVSGSVKGVIFYPELVAAFERCIEQLNTEVESILKQLE